MEFISKNPALWRFNNTVVIPKAQRPSGAGLAMPSLLAVTTGGGVIIVSLFVLNATILSHFIRNRNVNSRMSIEVKDLVKIYGEQKAVDTISFTVGKGEIVGFLGPNGAGKSTTMKILTGYLGQDSGEAAVCGISVREQPLETRKKIGYLPEANPHYPNMYVRDYLTFIAEGPQVAEKK